MSQDLVELRNEVVARNLDLTYYELLKTKIEVLSILVVLPLLYEKNCLFSDVVAHETHYFLNRLLFLKEEFSILNTGQEEGGKERNFPDKY